MKCVVIGLGQLGKAIAIQLATSGFEVIAIDRELRRVEEIKDDVSLAVRLDATDVDALRDQGVEQADVLVAAIGDDFEAQLLTVVHAKLLNVTHVTARAITPMHARILRLVGADEILSPEDAAARRLAQRLLVPNLRGYFELAEGFSVLEVSAPPKTVGRTFQDLDLLGRFRINLIGVRRPDGGGTEARERFDPVPNPTDQVAATDVLALVGSDTDLARFINSHDEG